MKTPKSMLGNRLVCLATGVAALAAAESHAPGQAGWWNTNWTCRRAVTVQGYKPTRMEGDDVAVVTIPTAGLAKPDGSDIRVATPGRTEAPCRVLMVGPGDFVKVAFALRGPATGYFVYFGNPSPPAGEPPLEIRRGVLQETWVYGGGAIKTLPQVQDVIAKAKTLLGRDFRDRINVGHNPFGPQNQIASRFTAYLVTSADGNHEFATSSQDASFLLVDDKVVVDNGGHHSPQNDIRMRGAVNLSKGLHKLTFYHVNTAADPIAVAAWKAPGETKVWPIPPEAFSPVFRAEPGSLEQYGKTGTPDFLPRYGGEAFLKDHYYQRWTFEAQRAGGTGREAGLQWDFGDGQKADVPKLDHVYLLPGEYAVTLTAKTYRGELKVTNRLFVSRPWDQVTQVKLDEIVQHARIVAEYDFAALSAEANAHAILLLERAKAADQLRRAGAAFLARKTAPPAAVEVAVPLLAQDLSPKERAEAYLKAEGLTGSISVQADMAERAARTLLHELDDPNAAMKVLDRILRQYAPSTTAPAIRRARICAGDVWRFRGNHEEALKAYAAAGYGSDVNIARLAIIRGDYARHVEEYLRENALADAAQAIDRWADDLPGDKLEGYWSLLVAQLHVRRKDFAAAAREAAILVRSNPASNYAPQLLLLSADCHKRLGKDADAKAALKQIVEKYPESPLAAEAAKQLK